MTGTIPRPAFCDLLHAAVLLLCFGSSACQSRAEPYAGPLSLNPQITVVETPPKPLSNELVVQQAPPVPLQPTITASIPKDAESQPPKQISQPPAILTPTMTQPVNYTPKRSGLSLALDYFLEHRNDEAIAALKQYPTDDQDIALVMLPILARMDQIENWASLSGPQKQASLESIRSLHKRLSKTAPLLLQHVTFVDRPPLRYGEVKPRANANYYPEDYVCTYAELVNLQDYINPEGLYNVRLEVTLELRGQGDKVFWNDTKPFQKESSISQRNDYHVAASFPLPKQLTPGSYQLIITVLDRDTNRTARQMLPIQVLDVHNKANNAGKRKS